MQHPLEAAVVPLDQVRIDLRDRPEAGQLAGPRGALQRAGEDAGEGESPQPLAELAGAFLTGLVQRDVGAAGALVESRSRPCRRAGRGTVSAFRMAWDLLRMQASGRR